ncbi:hypothetical protein GCM10022199_25970 [Marihabitans asiaticum]|uniref:TniQ protein n=1 Tax=Marihabitans asiaticum TaxID=415218 RepID=A0A560WGH4_9MICO|nr:TniQ family protein [Marihabitans asiaticum]TWD16781.1 TniQ protein [Marihabitans asiaticum]
MTTHLPLRIDPLPGEWWRGYVARVATVYRVLPTALLSRAPGATVIPRYRLTWSGTVATREAVLQLADLFRLDPDEVDRMHLSAFNGSAIRMADSDRDLFDPTSPHRASKHPTQKIGLIVSGGQDRWCPQCVAELPGYRAMTWRLQTHLICLTHGELLRSVDQSPVPFTLTAEIAEAQANVLSRLRPTADNAAFFMDVEGHLRRANRRGWEPLHRRATQDPEAALADLTNAVRMALARGYPDAQGMTSMPVQARTRHIRAPDSLGFPGDWNVFAHLLPTPMFVGGFSDLLYPARIRDGRAIAALGTLMSATGCHLYEAIELMPPRRRSSNLFKFFQQLVRLEQEGRAEHFWRECRAAVSALIEDRVDYRLRETVCSDPGAFLASINAAPEAHQGMVRTWLVDQWACTYTSSRVRPSVLDRSIEDFDRCYGPRMRVALEQLVGECAA